MAARRSATAGIGGGMVFTSKDVARVAGVSQSTVSYVLTGKRPISEKTRQRVLAAIDELTFQPNAGARALAGRRTHVIGLIVPFATGSETGGLLPFIETIAACVRERDYDVLLVTTDEGAAGLTRLAGRRLCDAIVLMDLGRRDDRIEVAASLQVPVILIGVPDDPQGLTCVDVDFARAAQIAVEELVETGHERIVVLGYSGSMIDRELNFVHRFMSAAQDSAEHHGVALEVVEPVEQGRVGVDAALDLAFPAGDGRHRGVRTGVIVPHAQIVQSAMQALVDRGLVPGRDLSVIGLATDSAAIEMNPPLTNVSLEPRDVSRRAMELLFRLLDDDTDPEPLIDLVPSRLSRRRSVLPSQGRPGTSPSASGGTI